ncbi:MAG: NUDIX domain-containing protein [Candidatus Binataceae bacterium]
MARHDDDPVEPNHSVQHRYPEGVRFCGLCGGELRMRPVLPDRRMFKVCAGCGYIDFAGPKTAAGCLVIESGRILLLRRAIPPQLGRWTFPGGYIDLGETPEAAAVRETLEEVGVGVRTSRLFGVYTDPADPKVIVIVYLAAPGAETPIVSPEASEVRYFSADEIPWAELAFRSTYQALSDWVSAASR